ncbi:MAG: sulfite exporter TauE/SafE family protein [Candidatus Binatia bacterium]
MGVTRLALVALAALAAGLVNAIAGGGSLLSFPALVAAGLPGVTASVTNTVALCPGYLGGTFAQRGDLAGQGRRIRLLLPAGVLGGGVGALLLLASGDAVFDVVVPFLLLFAVVLLALQDRLRAFVLTRPRGAGSETWAIVPVALAAVYGGYFGAGLGVIVLAVLAVVIDDSFTRLNALKQCVSLAVNLSAAIAFLFSGRIDWTLTLVMAVSALIGGAIGGAIASRVPARLLRGIVIAVGLAVSAVYFARLGS